MTTQVRIIAKKPMMIALKCFVKKSSVFIVVTSLSFVVFIITHLSLFVKGFFKFFLGFFHSATVPGVSSKFYFNALTR